MLKNNKILRSTLKNAIECAEEQILEITKNPKKYEGSAICITTITQCENDFKRLKEFSKLCKDFKYYLDTKISLEEVFVEGEHAVEIYLKIIVRKIC